jgi:hypothetical protein
MFAEAADGSDSGAVAEITALLDAATGRNWACFVDIEHHRAKLDGSPEPVDFAYRATHLLRREAGAWKVVLRHADPVASFRGPQFAHAQ